MGFNDDQYDPVTRKAEWTKERHEAVKEWVNRDINKRSIEAAEFHLKDAIAEIDRLREDLGVARDSLAEIADQRNQLYQECKRLTRVAEAADEATDCGLSFECAHKPNCHSELGKALKAWREGK